MSSFLVAYSSLGGWYFRLVALSPAVVCILCRSPNDVCGGGYVSCVNNALIQYGIVEIDINSVTLVRKTYFALSVQGFTLIIHTPRVSIFLSGSLPDSSGWLVDTQLRDIESSVSSDWFFQCGNQPAAKHSLASSINLTDVVLIIYRKQPLLGEFWQKWPYKYLM